MENAAEIRQRVLGHYRRAKRKLAFRETRDPYAIWICEVMAQQTRLQTVLPYWQRWLERFPTPAALAEAPLDEVLAAWSGLGYYSRARNLHRAAKEIVARHGGRVPRDVDALKALPGVGRYTAGAVASIAFGQSVPVVDGNVARVFARLFAVEEDIRSGAAQARLWSLAGALVPRRGAGEFNQGLMDIGATLCTPKNPACLACPLGELCDARRRGIQERLPRRGMKGKNPDLHVTLALVQRRGGWLVCRRRPDGLFGGLWELPEADVLRNAGTPLVIQPGSPLARHVHKLSHRTIHYRVVAAGISPRARVKLGDPYEASRFVAPGALGSLGVSSATSELIRQIQEK